MAFQFIRYLYREQGIQEEAWSFLEFVAIATVGDVMDLQGENRILVKEGLKRLRHTPNFGLQELAARNNLSLDQIDVYHIGFVLGPCLNEAAADGQQGGGRPAGGGSERSEREPESHDSAGRAGGH